MVCPEIGCASKSVSYTHLDVYKRQDRTPIADKTILPSLHAYLATVARNAGCDCYRAGGVADHVHLAIRISRTITVAQLVEELKTSSSRWLKTQSLALAHFAWQNGYGAFSVSPPDLEALKHYICLLYTSRCV